MTRMSSYGWLAVVLLAGCQSTSPRQTTSTRAVVFRYPTRSEAAPSRETIGPDGQNQQTQNQRTSSRRPINENASSENVSLVAHQDAEENTKESSSSAPESEQSGAEAPSRNSEEIVPSVDEGSDASSGDEGDRDEGKQPETIPPGRPTTPGRPAAPEGIQVVTLQQVTQSVVSSFPGLEVAMRELGIAQGKEMAAWGEFDLKLKGESIAEPQGFYKNYRSLMKVEQATMPGGSVYSQYRVGNGDFPVWYGERETNDGGEFKLGFLAALLRDRAIDQRRASIFQAQLRQSQVAPEVRSLLLEFVFTASEVYWQWVAAGKGYDVQRELLELTQDRNELIELRVKEGEIPESDLLQNQRFIRLRLEKMTESERKLQKAAIKLSLFLRDDQGRAVVATPLQLPSEIPAPTRPEVDEEIADVNIALVNRPELQELDLARRIVLVDYELANNMFLPSLNASIDASKDVGARASRSGDKTPFELGAGIYFEAPYQRRKAGGKLREAEQKLGQIEAKRRLTENKIVIQVQDAMSALDTAYRRFEQANENLRLAREIVKVERLRFAETESDLFKVALQEQLALEAEFLVIDAKTDYLIAAAAYRAAIGLNP